MRDDDVADEVADLLAGRTIATAESCTAGRVAEVLATVDKATDFLRGGVVAYQESVKRDLLGVTAESVLTERAAEEMAAGVAGLLGADVTVSTTGVAGDDEQDGSPPGTVYIATYVGGRIASRTHRFHGSAEAVCDQARRQALLDLVDALTV